MATRIATIATLLASIFLFSSAASALTMTQFASICDSAPGKCSDHPSVQAYVGGALDLIAMLDEETDYLARIYCKKPAELFDVPKIIQYMEKHREEYATRNATLLVIRYLEQNGGC